VGADRPRGRAAVRGGLSPDSSAEAAPEQLELLRAATRGRRPRPPEGLAATLPVARVVVDVLPAHLDRPFDYAVPADLDEQARPGVRVRVRFAGRDVDGFVLERLDRSEHDGPLAPLRRVVSPEPVLTPAVATLCRAVADRYAGTLADVLRLAVPSRHARTETAPVPTPAPAASPSSGASPSSSDHANGSDHDVAWEGYPAAPAFLSRLRSGGSPRAVWTAPPGPGWADAVAAAVGACVDGGRGALVVVPDRRDLDLVEGVLTGRLGVPPTRLEADLGPAARYRAFLAALRGTARVVVGTRAAAFAPVADLGLVVLWDDGDDQHAEPRAPYPHAREVLALRADLEGTAMLVGGWSWTAEGAALVASTWARPLEPDRSARRATWPRVTLAADGSGDPLAAAARIPATAWRAAHDALPRGPVLVQVPRAGYLPAVACATCRRPARCPACSGPLQLPRASGEGPGCTWCGRVWPAWSCPHCEGRRLRALAVGVDRTAEELGRAFPGATVVVSRADRELPAVPEANALVLATSGVEPFAPGGYTAALLLDGDSLLARPDLRAAEEALRRWRSASALVRPASEGGLVVLVADPSAPAVQALVRGDPAGHAERDLAERAALHLPPAAAVAAVTGDLAAIGRFVQTLELPPGASVLGPVPVAVPARGAAGEELVRYLVRAEPARRLALAGALRAGLAGRSARREPGAVRVRIDPRDIG
jgi:primosomal protein N' (replication factor Y) (superfamily II helicase)